MSKDFITIAMIPKFYPTARSYGELVHQHSLLPNAHNTPAADPKNNVLSHVKGKYGEIAFLKLLMAEGILPSHTPFRNNYRTKVEEDDFIVNNVQIEVKAKRRGLKSKYPPSFDYNVNLGKFGLDNSKYAFVEICPKGNFEDGPECLFLGWATADLIRRVGRKTEPGMPSDNGNFPFQRYDWDIYVEHLLEPKTLLDHLRSEKNRPSPDV